MMVSPEEKENIVTAWRSCCFTLDKGCVAYTGQFIFSMSVLTFCAVMLIQHDGDCSMSSPYINIISFMMGKLLANVLTSKD